MGFGGGSGSNGSIAASSDAALSNPQNAQVLAYDSSSSKWKNTTATSVANMAYYNSTSHAWPSRPVATNPIMWISTTDAAATQPVDMQPGDMWVRHPDALESA